MAEPVPGRDRAGLGTLGRLLLGHLARFRGARLQDAATRALRDPTGGRAWPVTVVNGSLRVRQALAYALYLRPRGGLSWMRFVLGGRRGGQPDPSRQLSLLCPTRGRVRQLPAFLRSLQRSAAAPGRVEVLFYVDSDDPDLAGYRRLLAAADRRFPRLGRCVLRIGEPVGVPAAWNALAAAATGDLLLMANDDQLYVDYGWDVRLDARVAELSRAHPDGVYCLYFDAGQYGEGAADFPIVSRRWYEALGYFTPTIFQQWEVERWMFDLARRVGRLHPVPGVFVEHRHYQEYKAPFDATYQRHRLTREKSLADHALFLRSTAAREQDAAALRRAIDGAGQRAPARDSCPDPGQLWVTAYLQEHHAKIRAEAEASLGRHRVVLFRKGQRQPAGCDALPVTAGVVAAIPEATTFGPGEVWLSRIPPGAPVPPPTSEVWRVQLGVRVPDGAVLRAGRDESAWPAGRCRVFDSRNAAAARYGGDADWIVLSLDLAGPQ